MKGLSGQPVLQFSAAGWSLLFAGILLNGILFLFHSEAYADVADTSAASNGLNLTLGEAVMLAAESYDGALFEARKTRDELKFNYAPEERYRPKFTLNASVARKRGHGPLVTGDTRKTGDVKFGISALKIPTGGTIGFNMLTKDIGGDTDGKENPTLSLTLTQSDLLRGGWLENEREEIKADRRKENISILNFQRAVSDAVVSAINQYRALIQQYRQVDIAESSVQRAQQQQDRTRALIQVGRVARREIIRSDATIANRELALLRAQTSLDQANFNLIKTLGLDSKTRIYPQEDLSFDQIKKVEIGQIDVQQSIETAFQNRTDYRITKLNLEDTRDSVRTAEYAKRPDLGLTFTVNRDRASKRSDNAISLSLGIPLDHRSLERSIIRAKNALISAERNLEETRESIRSSVRQAVQNVEFSYRTLELARQARELSEENLAIEQGKFNQGLSSSFEVYSSEDELVSAENAEIDAIISHQNALTQLDKEMGLTLDTWGIEVEEALQ